MINVKINNTLPDALPIKPDIGVNCESMVGKKDDLLKLLNGSSPVIIRSVWNDLEGKESPVNRGDAG